MLPKGACAKRVACPLGIGQSPAFGDAPKGSRARRVSALRRLRQRVACPLGIGQSPAFGDRNIHLLLVDGDILVVLPLIWMRCNCFFSI